MSAEASNRFATIAHAALCSAAVALSHLLDVEVVTEESDESAESAMALESKLADPDAILCCASMEVLVSQADPNGSSESRLAESAGRLLLAWTPEAAAGRGSRRLAGRASGYRRHPAGRSIRGWASALPARRYPPTARSLPVSGLAPWPVWFGSEGQTRTW